MQTNDWTDSQGRTLLDLIPISEIQPNDVLLDEDYNQVGTVRSIAPRGRLLEVRLDGVTRRFENNEQVTDFVCVLRPGHAGKHGAA